MRALVTGGAGFVGRHLCKALLTQGWEVVCVDPIVPRTGGISPAEWPGFSPMDFAHFSYLNEDCRDFFQRDRSHFDVAFHLAAMVGGRLMIEYDPLAVAQDLAIDAMYWGWAKDAKPERTVNFSSSAAYPIELQRESGYRLLREQDIDFTSSLGMPDMSYGWAKLTNEYVGRLAYERNGLKSVVYRPFSGYGTDQDLTYPFPSIVKRVEELTEDEIVVWGSGRQMRDFIHIDDCVRCVLATMDRVDDGSAINMSTGIFSSFITLAEIVLQEAGKKARISTLSDKPEGVFARGGDRTRQIELGFTPEIDLNDGVRRALQKIY